MKHQSTRVVVCAMFILSLSCVTVNVYFPSAEVEAAADRIVEEVYGGVADGEGPTSWLAPVWRALAPPAAYAADLNIDVSTPAIRGLLQQIEDRHVKLKPFYDRGAVGINARGYVDVRNTGGLDLKKKADLNKLVKAENADRTTLYKEIVKANDLDSAAVADVERIFAAKWREKAKAGWEIQADTGTWSKKS